jgi:16S rRNA G966 N2-methylase RsmD
LTANCSVIDMNCKKLIEMNLLKEEDNFDRLRVDAFTELKNFEKQLNQVESDLQRLSVVLKNLHEHNHFLQQQLKAYKEYLENVRKNCGSNPKFVFRYFYLFIFPFSFHLSLSSLTSSHILFVDPPPKKTKRKTRKRNLWQPHQLI